MKTKESSGWNKSWVVGGVAIAIVAVGAVQVWKFAHPPPNPETALDKMLKGMASDPASIGMGKKAAEAAVRLCGANGGKVVLVIPEIQSQYDQSYGPAYETGLRDVLKEHPSVTLEGIYFASPPCPVNQFTDCRMPTLSRLQDVRSQYPKASMIVSFLGMPQFSEPEQQDWLASNPPRMVVVDLWGIQSNKALAPGIVDAVIPKN